MFSYGLLSLTILNSLIVPLFAYKTFTSDWIVHLEDDGDADHVAKVHGFQNKGEVCESLLVVSYFYWTVVSSAHGVHCINV